MEMGERGCPFSLKFCYPLSYWSVQNEKLKGKMKQGREVGYLECERIQFVYLGKIQIAFKI